MTIPSQKPNPYQSPRAPSEGSPSPPAVPARRSLAVGSLLAGIALGWAIWAFSPAFTGKAEPWDSSSWYYHASLLLAGALSTLIYPRAFWMGPLGVYLGQVAYMQIALLANLPFGLPLILFPFFVVAIFGTLQPFLGALIPYLTLLAVRLNRSSQPNRDSTHR